MKARFNDLASVEAALTPRTAGILLEPIQGEIGVIPASPEFLRGLRRLCDERDILLMFDEIQCGFGRTGDWCAWHSLGSPEVVPDAIAWAKGMAAGFPMGAFWVRDRAGDAAGWNGECAPARIARPRFSWHDVRRHAPGLCGKPGNAGDHRGGGLTGEQPRNAARKRRTLCERAKPGFRRLARCADAD